MIQEQQSPQPELYEQVQFINTSDQPVCITGLDAASSRISDSSYTNSMPIVIQQQHQEQPQANKRMNQQQIILITSPNTTVLRANRSCTNCNCNQARIQYQTLRTSQAPRATTQRQQQQQTRIISAPFLPKLPTTTPIVKQASPIKIFTIKKNHQETPSSINHLKKTSTPTPATISIDTVSSNPLNSNSLKSYSQTVLKPQTKPTLAAMAGIQLTGSVEESLPAAMSGAMQNATATVEEINVPVFIDEYLQQTTFSTNNSFNNANINKSNPEGLASNGNGNTDNCIDESNFFEEFEFDISDLISTDEKDSSSTTAAAANLSMQEQQPQMYNNMYNSNNYKSNTNIINNDDDLVSFLEDFEVKSENIKQEVEYEFLSGPDHGQQHGLQAQYQILPANTDDIFSAEDTLFDCNSEMSQYYVDTENAVNFTDANFDMAEIMISSQNNPMLSACCLSAANSQNFNNEIATAEPIVPDIQEDVINAENTLCNVKMEMINDICQNDECDGSDVSYKQSQSGAIKRTSAATTSANKSQTTMQEKRRKLRLDTSVRFVINNSSSGGDNYNVGGDTLSTPGVIELIDKMGSDKQSFINFNRNAEDIMTDLLSVSNSSFNESMPPHTPFTFSSYADEDEEVENVMDHEEPPNTPQSCYSTSNYTNNTFTHTSPNSPALSTISNTTRAHSSTARSKRGRPAKTHSDRPDPSKLQHLSENERKRLEDRAKNNEASRLSRLKNKQREEQEISELEALQTRNDHLSSIYEQLKKDEAKLKRALYRNVQRQRH